MVGQFANNVVGNAGLIHSAPKTTADEVRTVQVIRIKLQPHLHLLPTAATLMKFLRNKR